MPDETDKLLNRLEKKISMVYKQADKEMREKLAKQLEKYEEKLEKKKANYMQGKITAKELDTWKNNQAHMIANTRGLSETLAKDLVNSDQIASALINGHTPDVYALNYNFGTYQIEEGINANTSFTLYNHEAVERLLVEDPDLLPQTEIDIPKDMRWNKQHINNSITQGILQGESIPKIAKRLQDTVGMDYRAAIRNARTATTGAQSAGRVDAYKRAEAMGIDMRQKWLATVDGRTRHSHVLMDGETIKVGGTFSNGCKFPGDPHGPGHETYNCRCSLVPVIKGFERDESWKYGEVKGLSYQEWRKQHQVEDSDVKAHYKDSSMSSMIASVKSIDKTDGGKLYKKFQELGENYNLKPAEVWEKYLNGTLGGKDINDIDDILTKYKSAELKKSVGGAKKVNPLAEWKDVDLYSGKVPINALGHVVEKTDGLGMADYWKKYTSGKIKDPKLDELLGIKKPAKVPKVPKVSKVPEIPDNTDDYLRGIKHGLDVDEMLDKENTIWKMKDRTKDAFETYSGSSYREMNGYLRLKAEGKTEAEAVAKAGLRKSQHDAAKTLQKDMKDLRLDQTYYLRRGTDMGDIAGAFMQGNFDDNFHELRHLAMSPEGIKEINKRFAGQVGNMASFTSTSSQWDRGFSGELEIIFKAPKGTRGCSIMNISQYGTSEGETLLGDNTKVKFIKFEESDGHFGSDYRLYLEIIPD